jgi:hypothetical protein
MDGFESPSPRRIGLTILFAVWLSIQGAVIGLSPAWGFILPHDHILRGTMTEADWQAHMQQDRLGLMYAYIFTPNCTVPPSQNPHVAESVPDFNAAASVYSFFSVNLDTSRFKLQPPQTPAVAPPTTDFYASDIFLTPLEPPPNI